MSKPPLLRPYTKQWIAVLVLALANYAGLNFAAFRYLYPGQWAGEVGMFPIPLWGLLIPCLTFVIAAAILTKRNQWLPIIVLFAGLIVPCLLPFRPRPEQRFAAEKTSYLQAVRTGARYGDQHSASIAGRKLTYWRWAAWGIDNAVGVIYDPEDRFPYGDLEGKEFPEDGAFRNLTHGTLFRSQRMGDGLYLVDHS
ncbi:MAG: hypothetical protein IT205_01425 [Fimbriimonadaceae bacterium]|nr:hypothetical protein [Fimbriimonadaceae bacterium]